MSSIYKGIISEEKKKGVAEGGADTSWTNDGDTVTLQDILELTKDIKQINLPINDNLKSKLLHWDGNPEEIERINQVTVSQQFPILIMVDEQGEIEWILDGNHRLHKAIRSQAKTIPAKLIKPSNLNDKAKRVFDIKEQGVAEGVSWKSLDAGLSLNDKIAIFEEYHIKGSLLESVDEDKKSYFVSLFNMSSMPKKNKKYIVVPLSLIGNRILPLDKPSYLEYLGKSNGQLVFSTNEGEIRYPSETMRDMSLFNTFIFSSSDAYNKFRTALTLKFDINLPDVNLGKQGVAESEKIKGVDGKACWKGYRYAGKEKKPDGTYKDKCVKVNENENEYDINQISASVANIGRKHGSKNQMLKSPEQSFKNKWTDLDDASIDYLVEIYLQAISEVHAQDRDTDHDAWREKTAAQRDGRRYHEPMKESMGRAYQEGYQDGVSGRQRNPRASEIFGPESNEYESGYTAGRIISDKEKAKSQNKNEQYTRKKQVSESRPTNIMGLIGSKGIGSLPMVEKIVDIRSQADGMSALIRTTDGNAYEVQIRQAEYTKHPELQRFTESAGEFDMESLPWVSAGRMDSMNRYKLDDMISGLGGPGHSHTVRDNVWSEVVKYPDSKHPVQDQIEDAFRAHAPDLLSKPSQWHEAIVNGERFLFVMDRNYHPRYIFRLTGRMNKSAEKNESSIMKGLQS